MYDAVILFRASRATKPGRLKREQGRFAFSFLHFGDDALAAPRKTSGPRKDEALDAALNAGIARAQASGDSTARAQQRLRELAGGDPDKLQRLSAEFGVPLT